MPVIRHNLEHDGPIEHSALIVASWARYAEGQDEKGNPIEVVDRIKDRVMAAAAKQDQDPIAFLRDADLFGDLAQNERFTHTYREHLELLHSGGARASLKRLVRH